MLPQWIAVQTILLKSAKASDRLAKGQFSVKINKVALLGPDCLKIPLKAVSPLLVLPCTLHLRVGSSCCASRLAARPSLECVSSRYCPSH